MIPPLSLMDVLKTYEMTTDYIFEKKFLSKGNERINMAYPLLPTPVERF
jgi:hypothetical protein